MNRTRWLALSLVLMAADQALKMLFGQADRVLLPGILKLHGTRNTGAAFSLLSGNPMLLAALSIALLLVLLVFAKQMLHHRLMAISLALVLGGALGNLVDRLARGYVVDYIEVLFINFPIFNLADILITLGAGLTAMAVLRMPQEKA